LTVKNNPNMKFGPYSVDFTPRLVFEDLRFSIDSGITHFWGKNGTGKTTVMNLMIDEIKQKNLEFSYINQNYRSNWLWWMTVRENLDFACSKLGLKYSSIEKVPQIQGQLDWLKPLLEGDKKQVSFNIQNEFSTIGLSGGQLQRVILLREILRKPKFLFLDEAFSALDKTVALEIAQWLVEQQKEYKFEIVSIVHNKNLVEAMPGKIYSFRTDFNNRLSLETSNLKDI